MNLTNAKKYSTALARNDIIKQYMLLLKLKLKNPTLRFTRNWDHRGCLNQTDLKISITEKQTVEFFEFGSDVMSCDKSQLRR